jgi:hypothetical protein
MRPGRAAIFIGTAVSISLLAPDNARTQSGADVFLDLLGGMMAVGQQQAASDAWNRQPEVLRYCFERGLEAQNTSIAALIRSGIPPTHPAASSRSRRTGGGSL